MQLRLEQPGLMAEVWARMRAEAEDAVKREPLLGSLINGGLLHNKRLPQALSYRY